MMTFVFYSAWKIVYTVIHFFEQNGEFCDLVFELNNGKFSAHRLVMAAWSRPMKNLLQLQSTITQHLHVVYDKPDTFHMFITFMYTGALPTQVTNISALLLLGATFQVWLYIKYMFLNVKRVIFFSLFSCLLLLSNDHTRSLVHWNYVRVIEEHQDSYIALHRCM